MHYWMAESLRFLASSSLVWTPLPARQMVFFSGAVSWVVHLQCRFQVVRDLFHLFLLLEAEGLVIIHLHPTEKGLLVLWQADTVTASLK